MNPTLVTAAAPRLPLGLEPLQRIAAGHVLAPACDSFLFARHGQTERNAQRIFQGPDEPLNATGRSQAVACAAQLAACPIDSVVCSDMLRARETAAIILAERVLPLETSARLRERNFGDLIGSSSAQLDWACVPPGGETLEAFVGRSCDALAWALDRHGRVLVVAHGGTLLVLAALLRLPLTPALLGNAQPLQVSRTGADWSAQPLSAAAAQGLNLA